MRGSRLFGPLVTPDATLVTIFAGYWRPSDAEVVGMRNYLLKGGFIIFDDMGCCGNAMTDLPNLIVEWQKAFPNAKLMDLPQNHPVFDSFFKIDFTKVQGYYGTPGFYAFYEDNDPKKRILGIVNNMQDLGDWRGNRADAGRLAPKGFPKTNRFGRLSENGKS